MRFNKVHFLVLFLYLILTLLFTYPLASAFTTQVPGSATWAFDEYTFLWNTWWFKYSLLDLQTNPLHTDHLFYPLGISLVLHTYQLFNALFSLPLQFFFGLPTISNLMLVFSFVLSGYGTYLLVLYLLEETRFFSKNLVSRDFRVSALAAFVAGVVYAFTASRLIYAALGHYGIFSAEWIPFYTLFMVKTVHQPGWKNALLAGLFATLALLCDMMFGPFLGLLTVIYLLFVLGRRRKNNLALLLRLAVLVVAVVVMYSPVLIPILREMLTSEYVLKGWGEALKLSADLFGFFTPTALHPLWGGDWGRELRAVVEGASRFSDVNTVVIGYGVLILAALAAVRCWSSVRAWVISALTFALLCLGPVLHLNGRYRFNLDGLEVTFPLPYALLHYIPLIKENRAPNRFSVVLTLSVAVLVGFGVKWILSRLRIRGPLYYIAGVILVVVVSFEHLCVPLPLTDARVPEIYRQIAAEPGNFSIMPLPLGWRNSFGTLGAERTQVQYYQTVHHKPLIGGNISRNPPFKFEYFARVPLFRSIAEVELYQTMDAATIERDRALAPALMYLYDVRYVVIHPAIPGRLPYADTRPQVERYVREVIPMELIYQQDGLEVYEVIQPPPPEVLTIDFGIEGSGAYRGPGWSDDEEIAAATANWAVDQGACIFVPLREMADHTMTLRAVPFSYPGSAVQTVRLEVNGQEVPPLLTLEDGWREYEISVPATVLKPGINQVCLSFAYLASPRDVFPADLSIGQTGVKSPLDIEVNSAGALAGSFAYITVDGQDASAHKRGYNLVVIDARSGKIVEVKGFDTGGDTYAAAALARFVESSIPRGRIVVAAVQEEGGRYLSQEAVEALRSIGAQVDVRSEKGLSHAVIGVKGAMPGSALELSSQENAWLRVGGNPDRRTLAVAVDYVRFEKK